MPDSVPALPPDVLQSQPPPTMAPWIGGVHTPAKQWFPEAQCASTVQSILHWFVPHA